MDEKIAIVIFLLLGLIIEVKAQETNPWSLEYSIAGVIIPIHAVQALYRLSGHSEFMFGPCFQNYKNDQGRAHAYTLMIGYRHTFWKNLTLDYELFPAYNEFKSSIDDDLYKGFEIYSELRPGYRFKFNLRSYTLYILPQLTIGYGIWTNNKWPDFDEQPNPAIMGNLWLGINF